jgi:radical SAM protein with 4Fe4S-binding SPASM domain
VPYQDYVRIADRERAKTKALGLPVETISFLRHSPCMATRLSPAAIDPDGLTYKCPQDLGLKERAFGSVFDDRVRLSNLLPWLAFDWMQDQRCRRCPVLPQCGGGCPHKRLFQSKSLSPDEFCFWFLRGDLKHRVREYVMDCCRSEPQNIGHHFHD